MVSVGDKVKIVVTGNVVSITPEPANDRTDYRAYVHLSSGQVVYGTLLCNVNKLEKIDG